MRDFIPARIQALSAYTPSDTVYRIRLDANECPFNASDTLRAEFARALTTIDFNRYPDPMAASLIKTFAERYQTCPSYVVAGNGSDELIGLLFMTLTNPGDKVLIMSPDFSMYAFYAELYGCEIIPYQKYPDTSIDFAEAAALANKKGCVLTILSNPCNPTGRVYRRDELISFVGALNGLAVIDEAYMEFTAGTDCSVLSSAGERDNLIVLKTLSKAYGMAALRVGFLISTSEIAEAIRKVKSPYNLNAVSQALAQIALLHTDEAADRAARLGKRAKALRDELDRLGKVSRRFNALPTDANLVYLRTADPESASLLFEGLKQQSIIIRRTGPDCLRITCGTDEENAALLNAITEILASCGDAPDYTPKNDPDRERKECQ